MKKNNIFNYVIIAVVLLIPFIYSFFYLKAYWNPYGEGNIDNLPVAVINSDKGDKGKKLINSIKEKKKLKLNVVSKEEAEDGLYDGKYYAIISIPETFTNDMESAANTDKYHATITYSPNQKSNYLASQIINNVVLTVEKNLDNEINSEIVSNLSENIEKLPNELTKISDGFSNLKQGTSELSNGGKSLLNGTSTINTNYKKFNNGVENIKNGANTLSESITDLDNGISKLENANAGLDDLVNGISTLKNGSDQFKSSLENYANGVDNVLNNTKPIIDKMKTETCTAVNNGMTEYQEQCTNLTILSESYNQILTSSPQIKGGYNQISGGIDNLYNASSKINELKMGISSLKEGSSKLKIGAQTLAGGSASLYNSSLQIDNALTTLNSGANNLNNGLSTLDSSVENAKTEIEENINKTANDVKKVEKLSDYSKEPLKVKTKEVNKINSYGTAFSPFFISIGLWVGSLMLLIVFYYDKKERFGILGINSNEKVKQLLSYHGLISISSLVLGLLLHTLLDFNITNVPLYYISLLLIGNVFMGIMEFLIMRFNDIGKFIALILLVLQLAAAGGTFPIETVTKGFRWMHNLLPMTYTVNLLKESLMKIENNLLIQNILVVITLCIVFFLINLVIAIKENKVKA